MGNRYEGRRVYPPGPLLFCRWPLWHQAVPLRRSSQRSIRPPAPLWQLFCGGGIRGWGCPVSGHLAQCCGRCRWFSDIVTRNSVTGHCNARGVTPAASKTHRIGPARVLVLRGKGPKVKIDTQNSKYSIISKIKARAIIEYFEIFEF